MPGPSLQTQNASWTNAGPSVGIPVDSVARVVIHAMATDHAGNAARWLLEATVKRVDDGSIQFVGITQFVEVFVHKTLGAALWDLRAVLGSTAVTMDVKGGIGATIDWFVTNEDALIMEGAY